ncbi:MAG: mannose-1-phosphate guanylyltransferase/mannose-6-phosphate isomerase [Candidatus Thioglobus sp.]|nr:MAG: mannose-1-phosphate guanylyltransferase/mannose-6-phosphate isomerase [Candidatus Thioglobus sp.]
MKIIPVILSGGSGTRLWPLSRQQYPKQYLPLVGDKTMLQNTILRLQGLDNLAEPIIVCNVEHRFLVAEQCQQIGIKTPLILLEPVGRNTAPAIAAAALQALKMADDAVLLVLSADHIIEDVGAFHQAIGRALAQAIDDKLVTFGIVPTAANTGYGYIQLATGSAGKVKSFHEKPSQKVADEYLQINAKLSAQQLEAEFLWNAGMFMFRPQVLVDELAENDSKVVAAVAAAVDNASKDLDFVRLDEQEFAKSAAISIDYALLEKSKNVVVVPLDAKWGDIGSWNALYDIYEKDDNGNVIQGDVSAIDSTNNYINACHHIVATIGIDGLIIVDTPDAILIADKNEAHKVKNIVEHLHKKGRDEGGMHRKVHRPWGWYDSIESGEHFQVKRLFVKPNAKISLQKHKQRAEHWVVVRGTALVINGTKEFSLKKGESTYIPINTVHSLANKNSEPLEIIEVQSGIYLGEDDIERLEDIYGRS